MIQDIRDNQQSRSCTADRSHRRLVTASQHRLPRSFSSNHVFSSLSPASPYSTTLSSLRNLPERHRPSIRKQSSFLQSVSASFELSCIQIMIYPIYQHAPYRMTLSKQRRKTRLRRQAQLPHPIHLQQCDENRSGSHRLFLLHTHKVGAINFSAATVGEIWDRKRKVGKLGKNVLRWFLCGI